MHLTIPPTLLKKSPFNDKLFRVYIHQLLNSEDVWFAEDVKDVCRQFATSLEQISDIKLKRHFAGVLATGVPEYFYYFEDEHGTVEDCEVSEFPQLFTGLQQTTFEMCGLLVLEKYALQHYELYDFFGNCLIGPCHDLDLLANGKFIARLLPNKEPQGFRLYQVIENNDHTVQTHEAHFINNYGDLPAGTMNVLRIAGRDELNLWQPHDVQTIQIASREDAINMLEKCEYRQVTSMSIRCWYVNDVELAVLAVDKNPLAYTLLDEQIRKDKKLVKTLLQSGCDVKTYIDEYAINPSDYLSNETIGELIKEGKLNMRYITLDLISDPNLLQIGAEYDDYFLEFAENNAPHLLDDKEILLIAAGNNSDIFSRVSPTMLEDRSWVLAILERNFGTLVYAPNSVKNDRDLIAEVLTYRISQLSDFFRDATDETLSEYSPLLVHDFKLNKWIKENFVAGELPF
jgi:hypothetical protein